MLERSARWYLSGARQCLAWVSPKPAAANNGAVMLDSSTVPSARGSSCLIGRGTGQRSSEANFKRPRRSSPASRSGGCSLRVIRSYAGTAGPRLPAFQWLVRPTHQHNQTMNWWSSMRLITPLPVRGGRIIEAGAQAKDHWLNPRTRNRLDGPRTWGQSSTRW